MLIHIPLLLSTTSAEDPENDPSFSYAVYTPSVLYLYDGLTYMDIDQPQQAWDILAKVDGLHPNLKARIFSPKMSLSCR